ncbi:MAG: DUF4339 domain-containing protein [Opitutales bacterium]
MADDAAPEDSENLPASEPASSEPGGQPEYYIRNPDNEEARGPFNFNKLSSLAEAGQITAETVFYHEASEAWVHMDGIPGMRERLFPERQKLKLRKDDAPVAAPPSGKKKKPEEAPRRKKTAEDHLPAVKIDDMLAAAEGRTEDTKHLRKREENAQKAGALSLPGVGIIMALMAFTMIYPEFSTLREAVAEQEWGTILARPFLVVGLVDLVLAIFLFLSVTEIYPFLRFRAMLNLGFWGYLFWAGGDPVLLGAVVLGSIGLFTATLTLNLYVMIGSLAVGILGTGYMAYQAFTGVLGRFL